MDSSATSSEVVRTPKSVHQCAHCDKIFVSLKGLQQHAIIHTDDKPFICETCNKSFRFKSNLFEHRSVHSGFTPHSCPFCGKTCRLKGNLKKHLKTHVQTKEELDEAWRPFASNRRPPAVVPQDAVIIKGGSPAAALQSATRSSRKKKLGLGRFTDWAEKIRRGDMLPQAKLVDKMQRLNTLIENAEKQTYTMIGFFTQARAMAFERFDCPMCRSTFMSRLECVEHLELHHQNYRDKSALFCETCLKCFSDKKSMEQHKSYHNRVKELTESMEVQLSEPELLLPQACEEDAENAIANTTVSALASSQDSLLASAHHA